MAVTAHSCFGGGNPRKTAGIGALNCPETGRMNSRGLNAYFHVRVDDAAALGDIAAHILPAAASYSLQVCIAQLAFGGHVRHDDVDRVGRVGDCLDRRAAEVDVELLLDRSLGIRKECLAVAGFSDANLFTRSCISPRVIVCDMRASPSYRSSIDVTSVRGQAGRLRTRDQERITCQSRRSDSAISAGKRRRGTRPMELWLHCAAAELEFSRRDVIGLIGFQIVMAKEIHERADSRPRAIQGARSAGGSCRAWLPVPERRTHAPGAVQVAVDEGAMHGLQKDP